MRVNMEHVSNAWSTIIAVAAAGIYAFDRPDLIWSTHLNAFSLAYFAVDLFRCPPINVIHHVCAGGLFYVLWNEWDPKNPLLSLFICKIEISTIPFNLMSYVPDSLNPVTTAAFVVAFFKIRVLDYYFFLQNPEVEAHLTDSFLLRASFYVLYAINLYWFAVILKTACGDRALGAHYVNLCQKVATYTYLGTLPAAWAHSTMLRVYSSLAVSSYFYHKGVATNNASRGWFIADSVAVHAVTLFNVTCAPNTGKLPYLSLVVNAAMLAARLRISKHDVAIAVSIIPVVVDCGVIWFSDAPQPLKFDYLMQVYLCFLVLFVNFFNDMSFICIHVMMWFNARTVAQIGGY